jgi:GT2 family glycosyltransferase
MVSIIIAAHGRPDDLRLTLRDLTRQTYRPLELIVVDDGSPAPLEPIVRAEWPTAVIIRHETSVGAHRSRNEAMARARGDFILTLDDDSSPCEPDAVTRAVECFGRDARLGVLAFLIDERDVPGSAPAGAGERYVNEFINCGQMMRAAVAREVGGYRDFFQYYSEESDYALRVLDRGWRILFVPSLVVHHRQSLVGRERGRIVGYRLRNALWTVMLDYPFPQVMASAAFKSAGGLWEVARLGEWRWGAWAFASFFAGLPRVLRDRRPVAADTLRRNNQLKFRWITHAADLDADPVSLAERVRWYWRVWPRRRRFGADGESPREDAGQLILMMDPRAIRSRWTRH